MSEPRLDEEDHGVVVDNDSWSEEELEEEIVRLMDDFRVRLDDVVVGGGNGGDRDDMAERMAVAFHSEIQLMCLEEYPLSVERCQCHGFDLMLSTVSFHSRGSVGLCQLLMGALENNPDIYGTYYVGYWVSSMFTDFAAVYLPREVGSGGLKGLLIHVPAAARGRFLRVLASCMEMGILPCSFLRKVMLEAMEGPLDLRVVLAVEAWFVEASQLLMQWQQIQAQLAVEGNDA